MIKLPTTVTVIYPPLVLHPGAWCCLTGRCMTVLPSQLYKPGVYAVREGPAHGSRLCHDHLGMFNLSPSGTPLPGFAHAYQSLSLRHILSSTFLIILEQHVPWFFFCLEDHKWHRQSLIAAQTCSLWMKPPQMSLIYISYGGQHMD